MIDWGQWLPGLGTDEPEEEDAVSKTLRMLGQVPEQLGDIGRSAGQSVVGAVQGAAQTVQDAVAVPPEQRPPAYSGPSYAQPSLAPDEPSVPARVAAYATPTETEVGAVRSGIEATQAAEPVGPEILPEPVRRAAGAGMGALQTVQAASDAVKARIDPRVWGFAKDGIAREILSPDELARWTQLGSATNADGTPKSYADYQREQAESQAYTDRVEARYQQIKDDPDALTRYANASPAYAATSAVTDVALAPAVGALASGAARTGATALGAGARTARAAGYAADVAGQSLVDPTSLPLQPAADLAVAGLRGAGAAGRAIRGAAGAAPGPSAADEGVQYLGSGVVPEPGGATGPRQMEQRAAQIFGTTDMPEETGFILSDGRGLDFSGRSLGGETGLVERSHNDIVEALGDFEGDPILEFIRQTGAMRVALEGGDLIAEIPPSITPAQRRALVRMTRESESASIDVIDAAADRHVSSHGFALPMDRGKLNDFLAAFPDARRFSAPADDAGLGSGVLSRLPAGLRSDAFNAAQGGVFGAASEDLQAQQEGRDADPAERARRALIGGGLAVAGGRYARPAGARALGSGVVPTIKATPAQVAAAASRGPARGAALNKPVSLPGSEVPLATRIAVAATDDRAGLRWAENLMSDAAGQPKMRENDPRRASTLSRENTAGIGQERIRSDLEPGIIAAGKAGLQDELVEHLEDMQQRDILAEFYRRGRQEALDAAEPGLERMRAKGAPPATIAAAEQRIEAAADAAGVRRMRKREGGSTDMTWEQLDARLTASEQALKASGQWDQLQEAAEQVWAHNAETRRRAHAAGEMSADELAYYEETYPHYVPTVPLSHLDARPGGGGAAVTVNRGTQKLARALDDVQTSGERLNPLVATRSATLRAERSMQRNRVARAFVEQYEDTLSASPGTMTAPSSKKKSLLEGDTEISYIEDGKPVTVRVPKVVADGLEAAANMGGDPNVLQRIWRQVLGTTTSSMTSGRASFLPVNVARDVQDYAVRTATLEGGGAHRIPGVMGTWLDEAAKAVSDIGVAQFNPRGAVGAATGFAAGASVGDEDTTIGERLRHGAAGAVAGTFLVGANRVRATGKAREFVARGGGSGGVDTGFRAGERWLRDVQAQGGQPIRSVGDAGRYLRDWGADIASLQGIKGINERGELIARTAAMRRAEQRGLAPTEAVMAGRDITYDPDRAGTVARVVNGAVPFFNATVQSGAQFVRLFRQNPKAATATMVTTVAPVVAAVEAWNRSDPDRARVYDDVPDYVKNTGIVVVTPWAGSDNRGARPNYLWMPTGIITPFVLGIRESMRNVPGLEPRAEGTTPESDTERWSGTLNDILQVFNPVRGDSAGSLASNLVPPIVKQTVELSNNRDLYRGMPIMSDPADERASAASKAIASGARSVGRVVGSDFLQEVRPSGVEHLVRALPAYGDIVTGASDMVAPSGYKQAEDRPVANEPFLGGVGARFVRDTGGQSLQDAEADRLGPGVRAVLEEAGLPPSTIGTVGSRYQNGPLTREEQLAWQEATNAEAERFVQQARRDARWRQPATREDAIRDAMTKARDAGAKRARLPGSSEIQRRIRDEERMRQAG